MSTPNDDALRGAEEIDAMTSKLGLLVRWNTAHIRRLVAENEAQRELLRQAVEAMRDGLSVCNSVSTGKDRRVRRDGVTMYLQTEEWCDWLEKEVGPRIFDAATAINEHLDSNK